MNFYVVHVICDDVIFIPNPNKEKQIPLWVNHCVVLINIQVTKINVSLQKNIQNAESMLQYPFTSSTIVFKDPDVKLVVIATTNSTYTQVILSLMDGKCITM